MNLEEEMNCNGIGDDNMELIKIKDAIRIAKEYEKGQRDKIMTEIGNNINKQKEIQIKIENQSNNKGADWWDAEMKIKALLKIDLFVRNLVAGG